MQTGKKREVKSPFDTALNYISFRSRTVSEARKYLVSRGVEIEEIEKTIEKLIEYNYLNDERYAQDFVALGKHKLSRRDIEHKLKLRGIDEFIIEDALCEYNEYEEEEVALNLAKSVVKKYNNAETKELNQKIIRTLSTKGFSYECAKRCIARIAEDFVDY